MVADGERAVLWEKAARLAVLAAATVASGKPSGSFATIRPGGERLREPRSGRHAPSRRPTASALDAGRAVGDHRGLPASLVPSAARDASVGRPTELDAITGSVVRAARRLDVRTPMLDGLLADAARHS